MGGNKTQSTLVASKSQEDQYHSSRGNPTTIPRGGAFAAPKIHIHQKYQNYMEHREVKIAHDEQIRTIRRSERMDFINSIPHQSLGKTFTRTIDVFNGDPLRMAKRDFAYLSAQK